MAGRKKQSEQTAEEKLQQALVPEAEQPYKVPDNWCWTRLGNVTEIIMGQSPDGKSITDDKTFMPLIGGAADMGEEFPIIKRYTKEPTKICTEKDLIICIRATLGRPIYSNGTYCLGRGVAALRPIESKREFYKYFFLTFEQYLFEKATGTTFAQISSNILKNMPVPFPPLTEQQRIVERIETLFSKLDKAKEKLQNTLDTFETRKAAILHKAFSGELMGKKSDKITTLENIVETIKIGPFGSSLHKEDYIEDGVPVINPKHIVNQRVVADNKVSISIKKAEELSSYKLQENDIILGRRGEMGRSAPINKSEEGWICGTGSLIIRLKKGYNALFYSQIIASQTVVQYLDSNSVGSTLKNLNEKIVRKIPIPDYTLDEQTEIVRIIDNLLAKEQQAHSVAQNAITKIDLIKKSILARAFRGQLAANNPADEPAIELLKKVL